MCIPLLTPAPGDSAHGAITNRKRAYAQTMFDDRTWRPATVIAWSRDRTGHKEAWYVQLEIQGIDGAHWWHYDHLVLRPI